MDRRPESEPASVPVLIVTGSVGVGKTTVAGAVSDRMGEVGIPHTFVDMDALRSSFPRPDGDPFHEELGLANLADVWRNSRATGAQRLVLADVVETPDLSGYRRAIPGADIVVVRLVADAETIAARLRGRDTGAGLEWHLARSAELAKLMECNGVGDFVVDASEASPVALAELILVGSGWLASD